MKDEVARWTNRARARAVEHLCVAASGCKSEQEHGQMSPSVGVDDLDPHPVALPLLLEF